MRPLVVMLMCTWGVAEGIMVSTYTSFGGLFWGSNVAVRAGSPVACGGQCLLHPDCGTYIYRPREDPNCYLMTGKVYNDKKNKPGMYFSGVSLTTGHFLFRVPVADPRFESRVEQCTAGGAQLVLFPAVLKDLIATGSHGIFFYNLRRDSEDTETFTTHEGAPVDTSLLYMAPEPSKEDVAPQYIASNRNWLYRLDLNLVLASDFVLCQYPVK